MFIGYIGLSFKEGAMGPEYLNGVLLSNKERGKNEETQSTATAEQFIKTKFVFRPSVTIVRI